MFICEECENVFEYPEVYRERHPYGMGYATEEFACCPHCKSDRIDPAKECERCGKYSPELEDGLCECCHGDMYGE